MQLKSDDNAKWGESLKDFEPEYTAVKVWHPIQMYRLIGKRTVISLDNFEPTCGKYALYSPQERRYYLKTFPAISLWLMLFYKTNEDWDSWDRIVNDFRQRIGAGLIHLLLTEEEIKDMTEKLVKLYTTNLSDEGKLDYKLYIELADLSLRYEEYKDKSKSLTGFRTVCNTFETKIAELWKLAHTQK